MVEIDKHREMEYDAPQEGGNLATWNQLNRPPASALKKIGGGRLKGMTDINPQWRYHVLTEVFGPCGTGWKYTIDKLWLEQGGNETCAFAMVSLYVKISGSDWSDAIPGIGGSKLVASESSGPHTSDECFKMAVTDALSVACKMLGVAADIYAGLWDGSKYIEKKDKTKPVYIAKDQQKEIYDLLRETETDVDRFLEVARADSLELILLDSFPYLIKNLHRKADKLKGEVGDGDNNG